MAKPKQDKETGRGGDKATAPVSALSSRAGRDWLAHKLLAAELRLRHGPDGQGWQYNESLRLAANEQAEFLRALVILVDSI